MIEPLLQAERLLLHGMVDQAEELFRRTAEQDPQNAIAVVGLARVALERGDDELALTHARAALAIDPENAAAVRLELRLTEVLAARGESGGRRRTGTPRWSSTTRPETPAATPAASPAASPATPAASPAASPAALPSEQPVFARNPSMADHRRQTEAGESTPGAGKSTIETGPRPGLLGRLLGRRRRG